MVRQDAEGRGVDVWTNFERYGLQAPAGLLRADAHRPPFRDSLCEVFDAIVCDPPYGVWAPAQGAFGLAHMDAEKVVVCTFGGRGLSAIRVACGTPVTALFDVAPCQTGSTSSAVITCRHYGRRMPSEYENFWPAVHAAAG